MWLFQEFLCISRYRCFIMFYIFVRSTIRLPSGGHGPCGGSRCNRGCHVLIQWRREDGRGGLWDSEPSLLRLGTLFLSLSIYIICYGNILEYEKNIISIPINAIVIYYMCYWQYVLFIICVIGSIIIAIPVRTYLYIYMFLNITCVTVFLFHIISYYYHIIYVHIYADRIIYSYIDIYI
jgi:hypothetical protein